MNKKRSKLGPVTVIFILMINLPNLAMILDLDPTPLFGKLAKQPPWPRTVGDIVHFPGRFRLYYTKNFGFRGSIVRLHGLIKQDIFGCSPSPRVLIGKDGWLFLRTEKAPESSRGLEPFDKGEVDQWLNMIDRRLRFCQSLDIAYRFVVVPNKQTIYPEHLRSVMSASADVTRLDQLLKAADSRSLGNVVLDLRSAMRRAKKETEFSLYYSTDTHWNNLGSYVGHIEVIKSIKRNGVNFAVAPVSRLAVESTRALGGDLARLSGLKLDSHDELIAVRRPDWRQIEPEPDAFFFDSPKMARNRVFVCREGDVDNVILLHDSFGIALIPHLAHYFNRMRAIFTHEFSQALIQNERPDVVIQVVAERRLHTLDPRKL
ncbi:MAG: hypothetical protein V3W41_00265 [Planctomycetota bacterium]